MNDLLENLQRTLEYCVGATPAPGVDFALVGCTVAPGFDFADFERENRQAHEQAFPAVQTWTQDFSNIIDIMRSI